MKNLGVARLSNLFQLCKHAAEKYTSEVGYCYTKALENGMNRDPDFGGYVETCRRHANETRGIILDAVEELARRMDNDDRKTQYDYVFRVCQKGAKFSFLRERFPGSARALNALLNDMVKGGDLTARIVQGWDLEYKASNLNEIETDLAKQIRAWLMDNWTTRAERGETEPCAKYGSENSINFCALVNGFKWDLGPDREYVIDLKWDVWNCDCTRMWQDEENEIQKIRRQFLLWKKIGEELSEVPPLSDNEVFLGEYV